MIRNLPYSEAGRRGHLDIYLPAGDDAITDAPVLLQVHGGAWSVGQKEHQARPLMNRMAAKGWICVAINYRLSPATRGPPTSSTSSAPSPGSGTTSPTTGATPTTS